MTAIKVYEVFQYSDELAAELGRLMLDISEESSKESIAKKQIEKIIRNPDKALFVAELNNKIIGTATVNIICGLTNDKGWLRDFVVKEKYRNKGIGDALWQAITEWCKDREINLLFGSNPTANRNEARRFYEKHGAQKTSTDLYFYKIV